MFACVAALLVAGGSGKATNRPKVGSDLIYEWDVDQVSAWLSANDFDAPVVAAFADVNGNRLGKIDEEATLEKDFGMDDRSDRLRLLHLIGAVRRQCPVRTWKAHQVESFVGEVGLMHDAYRFGDLEIDGADFLAIAPGKLRGLGVSSPDTLKRLQRAVAGVRLVCARADIESWDMRAVQEFLVVVNQERHAAAFKEHGITGRLLRRLVTHELLRDIGIVKFADQEEIIDSINELELQSAAIINTSAFVGDIAETMEQVLKLMTVAGGILLLATNCCKADQDLHTASKAGDVEAVQAILDSNKVVNLEETDNNSWTPLFHAAYNGHDKIVRMLIEHGANVNFSNNKDLATPLWIACFNGRRSTAEVLLDNGADIDQPSNNGCRPIHIAQQRHHHSLALYLANRGATSD